MSGVARVFMREIASYCARPIAYVFSVIFLMLAGVFVAMTETVSPRPIPRCERADASRRERLYVSLQVNLRSPWITEE